MSNKPKPANAFLTEVVSVGGFPLTRADYYEANLANGFSKADADRIAFGYARPMRGVDAMPLADFLAATALPALPDGLTVSGSLELRGFVQECAA